MQWAVQRGISIIRNIDPPLTVTRGYSRGLGGGVLRFNWLESGTDCDLHNFTSASGCSKDVQIGIFYLFLFSLLHCFHLCDG